MSKACLLHLKPIIRLDFALISFNKFKLQKPARHFVSFCNESLNHLTKQFFNLITQTSVLYSKCFFLWTNYNFNFLIIIENILPLFILIFFITILFRSQAGCRWFTFYEIGSECILFKNCATLDQSCQECVSGERRCSQATTTIATTTTITTTTDETTTPKPESKCS